MLRANRDPRPRVLAVQPARSVWIEADPLEGRSAAPTAGVAIVAHWDPDGRVGRSTSALVAALVGAGYRTTLVSAAPGRRPLDWSSACPGVTVMRRPNIGYDFGSWATALDRVPAVRVAAAVLLVNDSLAGPFAPIDHLLDRFHRSRADVWAMTDTSQMGHHLQSYWLGFKGGCLDREPLGAFWQGIRVEASRDEVIHRYELGLSRLVRREHLTTEVAIEGWRAVDGDDNPTIVGWRRLLDLGFPFVKRQVLRDPGVCLDGAEVPRELRRRFDVESSEWL